MTSLIVIFFSIALGLSAADFQPAMPGYKYEFPRDHFNHPEFQIEWWYYTGNLHTSEGRRFGFELTFFRHGLARPAAKSSSWQVDDLYLAHFALTDIDSNNFYYRERINRAGPGLAGASAQQQRIWNGNWRVSWHGDIQSLAAIADMGTLQLGLTPRKPPVVHGRDGISRKGPAVGRASHYISLSRVHASGNLQLNGTSYELSGTAWMDHEFFTDQLTPEQTGWDWFAIQLDNGTELMLLRLRRGDGSDDPYTQGTYIDRSGNTHHLASSDFTLTPATTWTSPITKAMYPIEWALAVPSLNLSLTGSTPVRQQELAGHGDFPPPYWEGAMDYRGTSDGQPIGGVGYLEMSGYAKPVSLK